MQTPMTLPGQRIRAEVNTRLPDLTVEVLPPQPGSELFAVLRLARWHPEESMVRLDIGLERHPGSPLPDPYDALALAVATGGATELVLHERIHPDRLEQLVGATVLDGGSLETLRSQLQTFFGPWLPVLAYVIADPEPTGYDLVPEALSMFGMAEVVCAVSDVTPWLLVEPGPQGQATTLRLALQFGDGTPEPTCWSVSWRPEQGPAPSPLEAVIEVVLFLLARHRNDVASLPTLVDIAPDELPEFAALLELELVAMLGSDAVEDILLEAETRLVPPR